MIHTKHGKLTGLGSSVGRESAPRISFIVCLLDEAVKCGQTTQQIYTTDDPTKLPGNLTV